MATVETHNNLNPTTGGELSGGTASILASSETPGAGVVAIGVVDNVTGTVTVIRANGVIVELKVGDPLFQGDVLETGPDGAIGVVLVDETAFSMAEGGRMVLDEVVFEADAEGGSISISVLQGVFTFVSGDIAKSDPDAMTVTTPMGSVDIRGAQVGIDLSGLADGEPMLVVLMEGPDGFVGEVLVANGGGVQILNIAGQGVTVDSSYLTPSNPVFYAEGEVSEIFGSALAALPSDVGVRRIGQEDGIIGNEDFAGAEGIVDEAEDLENFDTAAGGDAEGDGKEGFGAFGENIATGQTSAGPQLAGAQDISFGDGGGAADASENDPIAATETEGDGTGAAGAGPGGGGGNSAPVISSSPSFTMNEDGTITITESQLLAGASDVDGDTLSVIGLSVEGGAGTLTGPDVNGDYTYQPAADFNGDVTLNYSVSDGTTSVAQTAGITVEAVADAPTVSMTVTFVSETSVAVDVPASNTVLNQADSSHVVTLSGVPTGAVLNAGVDNGDGSWTMTGDLLDDLTLTPPSGDGGNLSLSISVIDPPATPTANLISASFDNSVSDGFTYVDDAFRGTSEADYASGQVETANPGSSDGYMRVELGGVDDDAITGMSGGFTQGFTVGADGTGTLTFSYKVDMASQYDDGEYAEVLVSIDGALVSVGGNDYVAQVTDGDIGWTTVTLDLGDLGAGAHILTIGGYNNQKDDDKELTTIDFDDISLDVAASGTEIATESVGVNTVASVNVFDIDISAALADTDGSETLAVSIDSLPNGVSLSPATANGSGGWDIDLADLDSLTMTVSGGVVDFNLQVSATSSENSTSSTSTTTTNVWVDADQGDANDKDVLGLDTDDHIIGDQGEGIGLSANEDTIYGGGGDDHLQGLSGDDTIYGGSGDDLILGGNDMDYLEGGGGGDVIQGGGDDDIIIGGEGNDQLYGGAGDDTFNFSLGDGVDTIYDFAGGDTLNFDGISLNSADSFDIAASGDDVVITVVGSGGGTNTVTLKDAALNMDTATREALSNDGGDSYSVTDTSSGINVVIDTPS